MFFHKINIGSPHPPLFPSLKFQDHMYYSDKHMQQDQKTRLIEKRSLQNKEANHQRARLTQAS